MVHGWHKYSCYCILFLSILVTCDALIEDKNFALYKIIAFTNRDRQILYVIHNNFEHGNFLNGITNEAAIPMHVAVENKYLTIFEAYLNSSDCLYTKYGDYEYVPETPQILREELNNDTDVLLKFNDYSKIQKIYQHWRTKYSKNFKKIVIGKTEDDNEISILKVFRPSQDPDKKKPAVFVLGGEEGRDWMSSAVVLAYVKKLLEGDFDDPDEREFWTQRFDMYFLPVLNPDGYTYSLYKDRFWAKNKKIITPQKKCGNGENTLANGVNIDRNWQYKRKDDNACTKMYLGHYLSENETSKLANFLDGLAPRTLAFFNVKGFDNLITTPFADKNHQQTNLNTIMEILHQTSHDMSISFEKSYYHGTTGSLLFNYSGNCADWVKEYLNVPVVATIYLKHKDHVIPEPSDIIQLCKELAGGMNLIVTLTIDLYEPLFQSQSKLTILNLILLIICACFIF